MVFDRRSPKVLFQFLDVSNKKVLKLDLHRTSFCTNAHTILLGYVHLGKSSQARIPCTVETKSQDPSFITGITTYCIGFPVLMNGL